MRLPASARSRSNSRRGIRRMIPPWNCRKYGPNWNYGDCTPEDWLTQDSSDRLTAYRLTAESEFVRNAERNNGIKLKWRGALIDLCLLCLNVALDGWIGADCPAV